MFSIVHASTHIYFKLNYRKKTEIYIAEIFVFKEIENEAILNRRSFTFTINSSKENRIYI
jgi:hypothetical protein